MILRDAARKIVEVLSDVEFALAWPSISKSFGATGHFVWHDEPLDATLSLTDFVAALTGDRSGLKLRLAGAPLKFAFDGSVSHKPRTAPWKARSPPTRCRCAIRCAGPHRRPYRAAASGASP